MSNAEDYDKIDRHLRNTLDDDDYADMSAALDRLSTEQEGEPVANVRLANLDGVIPSAIRGYLRRCSSGGMSKKQIDTVQANVDEAERLGYFRLAIAEAILAAPQPLTAQMVEASKVCDECANGITGDKT